MTKNLFPKLALIVVLVVVAAWTLFPPEKTLKPGIDLAGGTSLVYEIDTQGLAETDRQDVAGRMITVLRRRIDPANIQNLVWRPLGGTRFEIQMPLASPEARQKRQGYEESLEEVLADNTSLATIMRSLAAEPEVRDDLFEQIAGSSQDKLAMLRELAAAYDQLQLARARRDQLAKELKEKQQSMETLEIDMQRVKSSISRWVTLEGEALSTTLEEFAGSAEKAEELAGYVATYAQWGKSVEDITDPQSGAEPNFDKARMRLDELNISPEEINLFLEMNPNSTRRRQAIEDLKTRFPKRADKIDRLVASYKEYRPFKGRLDDPRDLQRMLKGAGVLEFRILPTAAHPKVDADEMSGYMATLQQKGPRYASDDKYVWCEIENTDEWNMPDSFVAQFGDEHYVLASNKSDEVMLHGADAKSWKLENASPSQDSMGRRAISFVLDERGGKRFFELTGENIGRPLCILLDNIAISAPNLRDRIRTHGIIEGSFTLDQVQDMVNKLNAGSLPARLIEQPISVKTIGPSVGADNRDKGIKAGMIGFVAVAACMLVYYTMAGAVADMALIMNLLFIMAMMALLRATFTLPGIAGIILTIGMSVDANVLIFERIREELKKGSSLRIAVRNGYQKAFSTIFDANFTTFITAAILYWRASEEVKGFAIVLMLGIASSMFTALFVTRVVFDILLGKGIIKQRMIMLNLIGTPRINWMRARPVFLVVSAILVAAGLWVFFARNTDSNKYDIEFTGGTSVEVAMKDDVAMSRQDVEDAIRRTGHNTRNPDLAAATIYSIGTTGKRYEINTTATNKTVAVVKPTVAFTAEQALQAVEAAARRLDMDAGGVTVNAEGHDDGAMTIRTGLIKPSSVQQILESAFAGAEISEPHVERTVENAVLEALGDNLQIQRNLQPTITSAEKITQRTVETNPQLADFLGGAVITCNLERSVSWQELSQRFRELMFKPHTGHLKWYPYLLLSDKMTKPTQDQMVNSFAYASVQPEAIIQGASEHQWTAFMENEKARITAATTMEASLPRVTQFAPSIGNEAKTMAIIAIVLSLAAIVGYIWVRFGNVRYGLAAIAALVHDVCITLGAVVACTYIASTPLGRALLIDDFKINLATIAAMLTIIGYSLNDTIVVFDRIRENRHRKGLTADIISDSINQTLSRTLLTSFTTFIVVLIMYIFGGQGLRGFTFAIGLGVIVGTYSSIAIAAPILLLGKHKAD